VRRTAAATWQSLPADKIDAAVSRTLQALEDHRPLACSPSPLHAAVWSAVLASLPPVLLRRVSAHSLRKPTLSLPAPNPAQHSAAAELSPAVAAPYTTTSAAAAAAATVDPTAAQDDNPVLLLVRVYSLASPFPYSYPNHNP